MHCLTDIEPIVQKQLNCSNSNYSMHSLCINAMVVIMRKSGAWMTIWDDRILEIIRDSEAGNATDIAKNEYVRVSRSTVTRRLSKLADHGLLKDLGNGVYMITERGEKYLNGEVDADERPDTVNRDNKASA